MVNGKEMKIKIGKYPTHRWYHNFLYEKFGIGNEPKVSVHIDDFDTWSMDHTLSYIIDPMLKQLKLTKHGAPDVDNKDVPKELRSEPAKHDICPTHFDKWDWVLDEMIFAFESKHNDWEEQFQGPNYTFKIDMKGRKAYQKRISNGFRLFGKYYENLWD